MKNAFSMPPRRRLVGVLCVIVGLMVSAAGSMLWSKYLDSQPFQSDRAPGRTHELNNHGRIVYVTTAEWMLVYALLDGGIALAFVGIMLGRRSGKGNNR